MRTQQLLLPILVKWTQGKAAPVVAVHIEEFTRLWFEIVGSMGRVESVRVL